MHAGLYRRFNAPALQHLCCKFYELTLHWTCTCCTAEQWAQRKSDSTRINHLLLIRAVNPMSRTQLRWHVKPALTGISCWVSLHSNNSDQLCDVQASLDKWSTDGEKIYLEKKNQYRLLEKIIIVGRYIRLINLCKEAILKQCMNLKYELCILLYLDIHNVLAIVCSYNYNFGCWQIL